MPIFEAMVKFNHPARVWLCHDASSQTHAAKMACTAKNLFMINCRGLHVSCRSCIILFPSTFLWFCKLLTMMNLAG